MDHLEAAMDGLVTAPLEAASSGGSYVGIDPGLKGYTALIKPGSPTLVDLVKTPIFGTVDKPTGYNIHAMYVMACRWNAAGVELVFIEKQRSYRENGHEGNFMSGFGYGVWTAVLEIACLPYEELLPTQWKAKMGILPPRAKAGELKAKVAGMTKDEADSFKKKRRNKRSKLAKQLSREKATRLFPHVNLLRTPRCKNPDDNLCEALLLAEMARRLRVGAA